MIKYWVTITDINYTRTIISNFHINKCIEDRKWEKIEDRKWEDRKWEKYTKGKTENVESTQIC